MLQFLNNLITQFGRAYKRPLRSDSNNFQDVQESRKSPIKGLRTFSRGENE